ncbi:DUF1573 domain-containing protein [Bacteroides muris (ex Afrizal et al. 2022)]|uniref:DUF1573 domain-containing protein n=1 Tax=Bacteroides muris (ex Afrizal et al. 2022) TaxID=2516960 RepID=A0A4S2AD03_9BACE|nr:DUF1573 domain-containing protein [Bacteroides muris (ex Afrizal et al. 2022)]TGX98716.1 DUF1573 domain-containing protein [Bacteroides muris (ex Afrizal et al. 2022)]
MKCFYFLFVLFVFSSCQHQNDRKILELLKKWEGREILFPDLDVIDSVVKDVNWDYKIVTYIDSAECFSCKLNLRDWMGMKQQVDSVDKKVAFLFFLQTRRTEDLDYKMKWDAFNLPIVFDVQNLFCQLNHFPEDEKFRTFLLDKDNKVLAIGNPIHNPKVKELYLKIIQGEKIGSINESNVLNTMVDIDKTAASLGDFAWQEERKATFTLKNMGNKPLFISDVTSSCGCTSVDYSKEPVNPSESLRLHVIYKADHPGHFSKTITVYCNADASPIRLKISGNAK